MTDIDAIRTEVQVYNERETDLLTRYNQLTIVDHSQSVAVAGELKTIKAHLNELNAKEEAILGPIKQSIAEIKALFAPPREMLGQAERVLKNKIAAWQDAERKRIAEEQRRADEIARKERARLEAQAARAREVEQRKLIEAISAQSAAEQARTEAARQRAADKADALELQAHMIVAPPVEAPPKIEGVSTRKTWRAVVIDQGALVQAVASGDAPARLITVNQVELNKLARALQGDLKVPGVRAVCDESVAVRI
jgi:hypothetical protein